MRMTSITNRHILSALALAMALHLAVAAVLVKPPRELVSFKTVTLNFQPMQPAPPEPRAEPKTEPPPEPPPEPKPPKPKPPKPKPTIQPIPQTETKAPSSPGRTESVKNSYYQKVWERVRGRALANKPGGNRSGKVIMELEIAADGSLISAKAVSGRQPFTAHALRAVKAAAPFEPLPPILGESSLLVRIPINYRRR